MRKIVVAISILFGVMGTLLSGSISQAAMLMDGASVTSIVDSNSTVKLSISGTGTATASAHIRGNVIDTSKVEVTMKIQKYNTSTKSWKAVKSWTESKRSYRLSISKNYSVSSRGKYRVKVIATLSGTKTETVTKYSSAVTY